jgi:DNA-binding PadR family transcriptional regulator
MKDIFISKRSGGMGAFSEGISRSSFLVLLALADQPRHGLAIPDRVLEASRGEVRLGPGSLYGTLQKLVESQLIVETSTVPDWSDHDPRRRYYRLTAKGERALKSEAVRMRALVRAAVAHRILGNS